MADADNTEPDGPAMQRLLDVRCHLRYIANDLHTSDRTAMHMQEVARECLEKTHSMRVLEREHEARIRADERARIAAAIEDAHQQGTYPYEMARSIRANATPSGHQLDAGWHERAVAAARADERSKCEAEVERLRAALDAVDDKLVTAFEQDIADAIVIIHAALAPEPAAPDRAPTSREVVAAAQRAKQEVACWPEWKRALSEPEPAAPPSSGPGVAGPGITRRPPMAPTETPREKLRRDLDENAKRWASYFAEVCAAISTGTVAAVAVAELAPDLWVLPEPLEWRHDTDGWYVIDGEYWLRLLYDNAGSVLRRRDDGDHLIDLIRRRNAT